jgi:RND family efflux transporter MFP subunit
MHPAYKSDKPGIAPDCGMELVPVYEDGSMGGVGTVAGLPPGTVNLPPEQQQLIGVRVAAAERTAGTHTLRIQGRVATKEARIYRVIAGTEGWIREIFPVTTGSLVKKNQPLAAFYGKEFLGAQQAYFYALTTLERLKQAGATTPEQLTLTNAQVRAAVDSLRGLGMGEIQIQEIAESRRLAQTTMVLAPAEGLVLTQNVSPGQWFDRGTELYRIADLTQIWILADAFENEAQHLRPGVRARISLPQQGKAFFATVSDVPPQFDAASRTLKVRLETDNPGFALRPDMFVDVELPVKYPATITVPADAVVDSGVKKTVYVAKGDGIFEPRRVETGWHFGDRVEIVKGLMPGERIVVSGTFLIDSESRMKAAAAGPRGETSEDPVCGMEVDQTKAKAAGLTSEFRGQTYYFCSTEDKAKFDKEPTKYSGKVGKDATTEAGKRLGNVQWEGGRAKDQESAHVGHSHPSPTPSGPPGHQHP